MKNNFINPSKNKFFRLSKMTRVIPFLKAQKASFKGQMLALIAGFMIFTPFSGTILEDAINAFRGAEEFHPPLSVGTTTLIAETSLKKYKPVNISRGKVYRRIITAYSSTPEETDSTPFITASGSYVRFGIIAANWLAIGTAVRIPEFFGKQVFIVEDRMHTKYHDNVDVWLPSKKEAINFGKRITQIEVL